MIRVFDCDQVFGKRQTPLNSPTSAAPRSRVGEPVAVLEVENAAGDEDEEDEEEKSLLAGELASATGDSEVDPMLLAEDGLAPPGTAEDNRDEIIMALRQQVDEGAAEVVRKEKLVQQMKKTMLVAQAEKAEADLRVDNLLVSQQAALQAKDDVITTLRSDLDRARSEIEALKREMRAQKEQAQAAAAAAAQMALVAKPQSSVCMIS